MAPLSALSRLLPDPEFVGPEMAYDGPRAVLATVTESLFWPLSDLDLAGAAERKGWTRTWAGRRLQLQRTRPRSTTRFGISIAPCSFVLRDQPFGRRFHLPPRRWDRSALTGSSRAPTVHPVAN